MISFSRKTLVFCLLLVVYGLLIYSVTYNHSWSFDDFYIIEAMPIDDSFISTFSVFKKSFDLTDYRPVSMFSFTLEKYFLGELNPSFSHKINFVFYILTVVVLFVFLLRLQLGNNYLYISIICTLLFLVHPVHSSMVASLKNRDGLLSMFFGLLSLISLFEFLLNRRFFWVIFFGFFFALAISSKLDALGFLFLFLVIVSIYYKFYLNQLNSINSKFDSYFDLSKNVNNSIQWFEFVFCLSLISKTIWNQDHNTLLYCVPIIVVYLFIRNWILGYLVFLIVFLISSSVAYFPLALLIIFISISYRLLDIKRLLFYLIFPAFSLWHVFYFRFIYINQVIEFKYSDLPVSFTENPLISHPELSYKISQAIQTYFHYLKFMIVPKGYYFYFGYDMLPLRPLFHPLTLLMLTVILLFIAIVYFLGRYNKLAWVGGLWFFSTLFYASNLVTPVAGIIADRYAYIASAGFCMVIAVFIMWIAERISNLSFLNKMESELSSQNSSKSKSKKHQEKKVETRSSVTSISKAYKIAIAITTIICIVYTPFSRTRAKDWKNVFTLIEADMPHLEKSYEAHRIASTNYIERGMSNEDDPNAALRDLQLGEEYVEKALAIYDKDAFVNESQMLVKYHLNKKEEAFELAKKVANNFDYSSVSRGLLADFYFSKGNYDSAAYYYKDLMRLVQNDESLYYKYTNTLRIAGKMDEAVVFANSLRNRKDLPPYIADDCLYYIYFYSMQLDKASTFFEAAYDKGLRNQTVELGLINYYVEKGNVEKVNQLREKFGLNRKQ